jgi:hypothetical protein
MIIQPGLKILEGVKEKYIVGGPKIVKLWRVSRNKFIRLRVQPLFKTEDVGEPLNT